MMKMLMVLFVIAVGSCQGGRVKREDGTSTSTSTLGADPWFSAPIHACLYGLYKDRREDVSLEDCKGFCLAETKFACKSIEYQEDDNRQCYLLEDTKASQPDYWQEPCNGDEHQTRYKSMVYLERIGESVLIESTGGAAEWQGSVMGYFDRIERMENRRPVYAQRAGSFYLFHDGDDNTWNVGSTEHRTTTVHLMVPSTNLIPPTEGWQYADGGGKWQTDSTVLLTISPPDPSSTCTSIKVSSTGPAGTAQLDSMGSYRWEGDWLNGHKLFVGGSGNNMYLRIATGTTGWTIDNTKDSEEAGIHSGRATTCPCRGAGPSSRFGWDGWVYDDKDADEWREDESIEVTCV